MHLDIKKMKNLSTKALNDGLQFFIDLVSGEERKAIFSHFIFVLRKCYLKKIVFLDDAISGWKKNILCVVLNNY